ncbi:hypothetical protein CDAR_91761 [Caerostris darwini]|uniref:Uncharacterized protein n=1 Tax=Caerostris darwini TaxID=1538125 RepID=A0AAV4QR33_9ARAC|nr:hypothetical protein CDAR_91761 [Caerostris darwini]
MRIPWYRLVPFATLYCRVLLPPLYLSFLCVLLKIRCLLARRTKLPSASLQKVDLCGWRIQTLWFSYLFPSVEQCHLLETAGTAFKKLEGGCGGLAEERKQLSETERRDDPADPTT